MTHQAESMCASAIRTLVEMVQNSRNCAQSLEKFPEQTQEALRAAARSLRMDINLAVILQKGILPRVPVTRNWDVKYFFRPVADVSGDILDMYTFGDVFFGVDDAEEQIGILLLDASGHGIASALVTAIARPIFFAFHRQNKDRPLYHAMTDANVEVCREIGSLTSYLTGISVRLENSTITYVNAGHPPGLLYRAKTGKVRQLPNDGVLLGVPELQNHAMISRKAPVESGDVLFLYTDGLTEAMNAKGQELGVLPVARCLQQNAHAPAAEIQEKMRALVQKHSNDFEGVRDDITFLTAKR